MSDCKNPPSKLPHVCKKHKDVVVFAAPNEWECYVCAAEAERDEAIEIIKNIKGTAINLGCIYLDEINSVIDAVKEGE